MVTTHERVLLQQVLQADAERLARKARRPGRLATALAADPAVTSLTCAPGNPGIAEIAEIDGGEITVYSGNYDFYERERALREANREAAYARQQAMLAKEQRFIERFKTHAAKAAQVQSRVKALEKIEKIELPKKRKLSSTRLRRKTIFHCPRRPRLIRR